MQMQAAPDVAEYLRHGALLENWALKSPSTHASLGARKGSKEKLSAKGISRVASAQL
jgi:hypothetical protein